MTIHRETYSLFWSVGEDGFLFSVHDAERAPVPVAEWGLIDISSKEYQQLSIGPMVTLLEEEQATLLNQESVLVPHDVVSDLEDWVLACLGLPSHPPFSFEVCRTAYTINQDEFRIPLVIKNERAESIEVERIGCYVKTFDSHYVLGHSAFHFVELIERFNEEPPRSQMERFSAWGTIKSFMPETATVDAYLENIEVVRPKAFTLSPFQNENDEPDFDPVLLTDVGCGDEEVERIERQALSAEQNSTFLQTFRGRRQARKQYSLGDGAYLFLEEPLYEALSLVHSMQKEERDKRVHFLENPRLYFREKLGSTVSEKDLEELFDDFGYSDRVRGVGIWHPRIIPFVFPAEEPWLPPTTFGLSVGDTVLKMTADELFRLDNMLELAFNEGVSSILFGGLGLPVIPGLIQGVKALIEMIWTEKEPSLERSKEKKEREHPKSQDAETTVLLVKDNVEQLEFALASAKRGGNVGQLPALMNATLYTHQIEALVWLQRHWCEGTTGALLADDMGLGKTIETLSFLAWYKELVAAKECSRKPILIVAPTGLLQNWQDEHDFFLSGAGLGTRLRGYGQGLREIRVKGHSRGKETLLGASVLNVEAIQSFDWVLTTYETLRDYQHSFGQVAWSIIVFDEAQKIKNPSSGVTNAAKAMKAEFQIAVTGTPVENRLVDLWCIVDTIQPGALGSLKRFVTKYCGRIVESSSLDELRGLLTERTSPSLMLRRTKGEVLSGLPEISYHRNVQLEMPSMQARCYGEAVVYGQQNRGEMLEVLGNLRAISLHPDRTGVRARDGFIQDSARLVQCFGILDNIRKRNEKALVFLESRWMQGILSALIQNRYQLEQAPFIINGAIRGEVRQQKVGVFQSRCGFDVMILSPKAGGVGLTLTAANHVIHLTRWWNPAVEDQCTDRVYRIGQRENVHVYYPMAIHPEYREYSFDYRLNQLLERKRQLSKTLLQPSLANEAEMKALFSELVTFS